MHCSPFADEIARLKSLVCYIIVDIRNDFHDRRKRKMAVSRIAESEYLFDLDSEFPEEELKEKLVEVNRDLDPFKNRIRFKFALSQRQRQELLEVARTYSDTHELIIITQLMTGCRVGEIANLEIDDLLVNDPANSEIWIQTKIESDEDGNKKLKWKPKTSAGNRRVPVPDDLEKKIKRYVDRKSVV